VSVAARIRARKTIETGVVMIKGLHHNAYRCRDSEETRRFYEDFLGLPLLMQENRAFDHYFGTMSGVRGFGDKTAIPLPSAKPVWFESDGSREILPFHLDTETTSAMRVPSTPHTWPDAQLAWDQGRLGQ
jgi:phospholipase C